MPDLVLRALRPVESSNPASSVRHDEAVRPRTAPCTGTSDVSRCRVAIVWRSKKMCNFVSSNDDTPIATVILDKSNCVYF